MQFEEGSHNSNPGRRHLPQVHGHEHMEGRGMNRDELEAAIWREMSLSGRRAITANDAVDAILNAADAYAIREALIAVEASS